MVLRRYTPPTCTLAITAKSSPITRWANSSMPQSLQFELHFDAPQLPEEQQVTVRGDRAQLEALRDAVNTYVHSFLCESFDRMDAFLPIRQESESELRDENAEGSSSVQEQRDSEENSRDAKLQAKRLRSHTLTPQQNLPDAYRSRPAEFAIAPAAAAPLAEIAEEEIVEQTSGETRLVPSNIEASDRDSFGIYLQPKGLLGHDLFLGAIATEESGPVVYLGVSQLFDLATALDQYEADANALPTRRTWLKQSPAWVKTAAIVLVTVGVTASAIELLNRNTVLKTATPPANQQASNTTQSTQITRQPNSTQQQPVAIAPIPTPSLTVPAPPAQILPAPSVVQTTPLPKLPKILGDSSVPPNPSALPPPPQIASAPAIPAPPANSIPPAPQGNNPPIALNQSPTVYIPPAPPTIVPSIPSKPNSQAPIIEISPNALPDTMRSDRPPEVPVLVQPRVEAEVTPSPSLPSPGSLPEITPAPPLPLVTGSTPTVTPPPSVAAKGSESAPSQSVPPAQPNAEPAPALPAIEGLPDGNTSADEPPKTARSSQLPTLNQPAANSETPAATEEASGAIAGETKPLTEAQNYFQQRWKPPTELNTPLQYTLALNPDGSIQQIIPRGEASERYVDRTGMPLMNEPFVSRISDGKSIKIRVVLRPDGKVQTFEEP